MKLAEALANRSDLKKRLEQLKGRLVRNAKVQEGEAPAEKPDELLAEFEAAATAFHEIVTRINLANSATILDGATLTAALARRDVLALRQQVYRDLAQAGTVTQSVQTRSEVRFKPTISVAAVQKTADELSKQLRELDIRIQEANWRVEI